MDEYAARNESVVSYFKQAGHTVKMIGNLDKPILVIDNKSLSCYLNNSNIIFTKGFGISEEFARFNCNDPLNIIEFNEAFSACKRNKLYSIKIKGAELFISGYNFINRVTRDRSKLYPVFSEYDYKLYKSEEKAQEVIDSLTNCNQELIII